jgi:DNA-binding NarL/FixJ family response regulator
VAFEETALIVENDPLVAQGWQRTLRASAISTEVATSLAAAQEFLEASAVPSFVFLDLELPDGDGSELLATLTPLKPRPRIAVISGHLDASRVVALQSIRVLALPKPLSSAALNELLGLLRGAQAELEHPIDQFAKRHKLSPTEARLLHLAVEGMNNDEAACALKCARATVSTYWNRIFIKTSLRSQRDVVSGVLRAVVCSS